MSDRQKLERASQTAARGDRFRDIMADPDVQLFFQQYERDRVREIVRADATDDEGRRNAALLLGAMETFRGHLEAAIKSGGRAAETLLRDMKHG